MNGPTFAPAITAAPTAAPKPAPPRPAAPAKTVGKPDLDAGGGLRILTYLRLHWLMIVFCGTLIGSAGAYTAWELLPSKYESYALIQVSSVPHSLASGSREQARTDFVTYMKTTAALIKYEFVLNAALRDIKDLPTIKEQPDPIKFLAENLQVSASDGGEVIKISLEGHNPADTQKIVNAVLKAFMIEVIQKETAQKQAFVASIEKAQGKYDGILRGMIPQKPDAPGTPTQAINGMTPPNPNGNGPLPVIDPSTGVPPMAAAGPTPVPSERLVLLNPGLLWGSWSQYRHQVETLPLQIRNEKRLQARIVADAKALHDAPVEPATIKMVEADPEVVTAAIRVNNARRQYNFDLSAAGGDKTAPAVVNDKLILDDREAALAKLKKEKTDAIEGAKRVAEARKLKAAWDASNQRLVALQEQYDAAQAGLARTEKQLAELPPEKKTMDANGRPREGDLYSPSQTNLHQTDSVYANLIRQYHLTKLELDSPPRVRELQSASNPMQRDSKKQILATVFAGLMGFVLIGLGAVAYETMGKRVSSLADLKAAGPAPVVGVIPHDPGDAVGRNPAKRAAANEAIDKLRAYVAQTWLSRGATTVAITSPLGDEGKAFTAFGLASSLAQASYRTLLVDFDLREPALHTYAGVPNQNGVCELLRGELDTRSAIQSLPSGLHLLPAGKWSDEARKAAVGGKLEALLGKLKEPYDCVVLHGHALLTVAESVEVARRCEVVLVCARYRETKAPLIRKATDRVATMEIPYSGVVYVGATEQESLC